jgi:hypothetical protein
MRNREQTRHPYYPRRSDLTEEQGAKQAWQGVGEQFEALGASIAQALKAAWESEETRSHVESLKEGLDSAVRRVEEAARKASASVDGQRLRAEATEAAESLRSASKQSWEQARPHVVSALRQVDAELQKLIERLSPE